MGRQIRKLREATGASQERFALTAGIDRTYYAAIELGYRNVSARNLIKIAQYLKVEVGDLFPPMTELSPLLHPEAASDIVHDD